MDGTHLVGPHWHLAWIVPFLFMILMCFLVTRTARRSRAWQRGGWGGVSCWGPGTDRRPHPWQDSPRRILDRRFASGEITREQYEEMKTDLEPTPSASPTADG